MNLFTSVTKVALAACAAALPLQSHAELIYLDFSGGGSDPLQVTFSGDYSLQATASAGASGLLVCFDGVGDYFAGYGTDCTGNILVNSVGFSNDYLGSGQIQNDMSGDELFLYLYDFSGVLQAGDVVTISAGTVSAAMADGVPAPADGFYTVFLADGDGNAIGASSVVVVPEPSTCALWTGVLALSGALVVRRKRKSLAGAPASA